MTTLVELIKQKEALEELISKTRNEELADAISKVKAIVAENCLTPQDIFGKAKKNFKLNRLKK